jgi:uncharacterized protein (DUF302 family)
MGTNPPTASPPTGIVSKVSPLSVEQTLARLEGIMGDRGLTLFAHIDHEANAQSVGLEMQPAHLLVFGSARAGTPLMVASPLVALDLPLKVLVWQDQDAKTWVSYNSTAYLAERYGISNDLVKNIAAIDAVVDEALQR